MFFPPSEWHWFVFITAMEQALTTMCVAAQKEPKKVNYLPPPPPAFTSFSKQDQEVPLPRQPTPTTCPKVFMA